MLADLVDVDADSTAGWRKVQRDLGLGLNAYRPGPVQAAINDFPWSLGSHISAIPLGPPRTRVTNPRPH